MILPINTSEQQMNLEFMGKVAEDASVLKEVFLCLGKCPVPHRESCSFA